MNTERLNFQRRGNYANDVAVFIGRFQPLHIGHCTVIRAALQSAQYVVVVVGSSFAPRNIRNMFTFEERKQMIAAEFPDQIGTRLIVIGIADYPYNDQKWIAAVNDAVYNKAFDNDITNCKVTLIGHNKDHSSYYLKLFPNWGNISVENIGQLNATDVRQSLFDGTYLTTMRSAISPNVDRVISKLLYGDDNFATESWMSLQAEHMMVSAYKKSWEAAPYPPTFVTVDAVVVQSGHVLLVKRGAHPGYGQWALPGGFVNQQETLLQAAIRELREETRLKVPAPVLKGSIKSQATFDDPNRSTRGRTITTAFHFQLTDDLSLPKVKGSDDAADARWVRLDQVDRQQMYEDHYAIIDYFCSLK